MQKKMSIFTNITLRKKMQNNLKPVCNLWDEKLRESDKQSLTLSKRTEFSEGLRMKTFDRE